METSPSSGEALQRELLLGERIVLCDPAPAEPLETFLPDGTAVRVAPDDDPRRAFADWLVTPDNPWFARAAVNRVWAWLFGRGLVQEPDDIRPDNPPSIPEALSYLEREFADARWDLRQLLRIILNSRTYQQSPIPRSDSRAAAALFASYPVRRVDAEVLVDMLGWVSGRGEGYTSNTPEPWTFIPEDRRTITLPDGSITSPLLEMFGRPARDTGFMNERSADPTDAQALHLLNSSDVIRRIELSPKLRAVWVAARRDLDEGIRGVYVLLLSREPQDREIEAARAYYRAPDRPARESAVDLAWALISSKEFFFRH